MAGQAGCLATIIQARTGSNSLSPASRESQLLDLAARELQINDWMPYFRPLFGDIP